MKNPIKILISVLLSGVLSYFLLKDLSLKIIIDNLKMVSWQIIIISFFIYFVMNLFRVVRMKRVFSKIKTSSLINITFIHNMINNILPFRIGEFSYIYFIKKETNTGDAVSSFLVFRVCDLAATIFIFAVALLFVEANKALNNLFLISLGILLIVIFSMTAFKKFSYKRIKFLSKIKKSFESYTMRRIAWIMLDSVAIWFLSFLFYYVLARDFGMQIGFFEVSIAAILIIISGLLPIGGLAGFGTIELAWTIGLVLFGIDKQTAVISGFIIHIIRIMHFTILGMAGLAIRYSENFKKQESATIK